MSGLVMMTMEVNMSNYHKEEKRERLYDEAMDYLLHLYEGDCVFSLEELHDCAIKLANRGG